MDPNIIILLVLVLIGVIVIASRSRSLKHKNIAAPPPDLWRDYRSALDEFERELRGLSYRELTLPSAPSSPYGLPSQSLPHAQIETLLHIGGYPHGYELIKPAALPVFPSLPSEPPADQPLPLFLLPPKFSFYIDDPVHIAELGFTILLAVIASKVVGALASDLHRQARIRAEVIE